MGCQEAAGTVLLEVVQLVMALQEASMVLHVTTMGCQEVNTVLHVASMVCQEILTEAERVLLEKDLQLGKLLKDKKEELKEITTK